MRGSGCSPDDEDWRASRRLFFYRIGANVVNVAESSEVVERNSLATEFAPLAKENLEYAPPRRRRRASRAEITVAIAFWIVIAAFLAVIALSFLLQSGPYD